MTPYLHAKKQYAANHTAAAVPAKDEASALKTAVAVGSKSHTNAVPVIKVIKDGDKIIRLVVTCSCGECIEVECLYPES